MSTMFTNEQGLWQFYLVMLSRAKFPGINRSALPNEEQEIAEQCGGTVPKPRRKTLQTVNSGYLAMICHDDLSRNLIGI